MKKRVLHLLASNSYSGAENVVCNIINHCSDEYEMYYCSPNGKIRDVLEKKKIKFIPLKRLSLINVSRVIKEYDVDIVHAHDYQASLIAFFLKTKVVSHIHCDYKLLPKPICYFVGTIYSFIQSRFSKVIMIAKETLDSAIFKDKIIDKVIVLNNVIDSKSVIDKSKEFETKKYDLIFVGRLIPLKQPLLFIDIVNELKKKNSEVRVCIIGDGELYNDCVNKINDLNLTKNIEMLGFKDNPFPYFKNSKVTLMPSSYEGLSMVAIESMILGTMVINSGVGGFKTIFGEDSKYICKNIDEYVNVISEILKLEKKDYKHECAKLIKRFTDMNEYKKQIINIYEEVLKK